MTQEEKQLLLKDLCERLPCYRGNPVYHEIDFLNRNHFDWRGLIPMGLAIEVTEDNNPYK